jgi:Ser-tRNA(Ala) deacylase AlaX
VQLSDRRYVAWAVIERTVTDTSRHDVAVARHLQWAEDFAVAGDVEAAVDELLDVQALKAELSAS